MGRVELEVCGDGRTGEPGPGEGKVYPGDRKSAPGQGVFDLFCILRYSITMHLFTVKPSKYDCGAADDS